jgi:hypothetical protein
MEINTVRYEDARSKIRDGDILLFRRGRSLASRLIGAAGRSEYCHAAMAAWWNGRLMCLETVQGHGGRAVMLSRLVDERPSLIDLYSVVRSGKHRYCPHLAVQAMIEITGKRYGWLHLIRAAMRHLPVVRLFTIPLDEDRANGSLPYCSDAVSRALRAGGIDPVPNLADAGTEPADLARSAVLTYRLTLSPDPQKEEPCEVSSLDSES